MEKEDLLVIQKSKILLEYTFTITNSENRFPKKTRYTLVQRLQNMALDIVQGLIESNDIGNLTEEARSERRKKQMSNLYHQKKLPLETIYQSYQSWRGHAQHGDTLALIRKTDAYFCEQLKKRGECR